jgi:alpha-tubulin suppressor-like RCC1 family protein
VTNLNSTILCLDESSIYKSPLQIADIKCGGEHTVILSNMGRVYTFGHGWTGQLGLGNSRNYDRPIIVKSLLNKKIVQIAAGWSHTLVLTYSGNLYAAGCGKYGEL